MAADLHRNRPKTQASVGDGLLLVRSPIAGAVESPLLLHPFLVDLEVAVSDIVTGAFAAGDRRSSRRISVAIPAFIHARDQDFTVKARQHCCRRRDARNGCTSALR